MLRKEENLVAMPYGGNIPVFQKPATSSTVKAKKISVESVRSIEYNESSLLGTFWRELYELYNNDR